MKCPICNSKTRIRQTIEQDKCTKRKHKCEKCNRYFFTEEYFTFFTTSSKLNLDEISATLDQIMCLDGGAPEPVGIIYPEENEKIPFDRLQDFL